MRWYGLYLSFRPDIGLRSPVKESLPLSVLHPFRSGFIVNYGSMFFIKWQSYQSFRPCKVVVQPEKHVALSILISVSRSCRDGIFQPLQKFNQCHAVSLHSQNGCRLSPVCCGWLSVELRGCAVDYPALRIDCRVDGVICFGGICQYASLQEVVKVIFYFFICMYGDTINVKIGS